MFSFICELSLYMACYKNFFPTTIWKEKKLILDSQSHNKDPAKAL